jgi:hypothetical protein
MDEEREIKEEENVKQSLLARAEISLLLDTYDDIFSDFDPRPYLNRALSDDFLLEAKRAALDKKGALEMSFMIPKHQRNIEHEVLIKRRLREHFKKHSLMLENELHGVKMKGIFMALFGVFMILIATYLLSLSSDSLFVHFLIVVLEPGGWFTAWTGLDEIYYTAKQKKPDLEFYKKMVHAEITFHAY